MDIKSNLKSFEDQIKDFDCLLVAVSKTKPRDVIMQAYQAGQIYFGENRVQ